MPQAFCWGVEELEDYVPDMRVNQVAETAILVWVLCERQVPMIDSWERIWQDGRGEVGRGGACLPPLQACGPLPLVIGEEGDGDDIDVKANVVVVEN